MTNLTRGARKNAQKRRFRARFFACAGIALALGTGTLWGQEKAERQGGVPARDLGFMVGYAVEEPGRDDCRLYGAQTPAIQPPLFAPYNRDGAYVGDLSYWYSLAEEASFANVDFIALNVRGDKACAKGTEIGNAPTRYAKNMVAAVRDRGLARIKIAFFDDTAPYNDYYRQCENKDAQKFPLPDPTQYDAPGSTLRYWWDLKWKPFFTNVPKKHRYTYHGRPVAFVWGDTRSFSNQQWAPELFAKLRTNFQKSFGEDPFIIVDRSWTKLPDGIGERVANVVDAASPWIGSNGVPYEFVGRSGLVRTSVVNPGYFHCKNRFAKDRAQGRTLVAELERASLADIVLLEGHNDVAENAGTYRAAKSHSSVACGGCELPLGQGWAQWPSQYLNILREAAVHQKSPPVLEPEAADAIGSSATNCVFRRDCDAEIAYDARRHNWSVRLRGGDWFRFQGIVLPKAVYRFMTCYSSTAAAAATIGFESTSSHSRAEIVLPATDAAYACVQTRSQPLPDGRYDISFTVAPGADIWVDTVSIKENKR